MTVWNSVTRRTFYCMLTTLLWRHCRQSDNVRRTTDRFWRLSSTAEFLLPALGGGTSDSDQEAIDGILQSTFGGRPYRPIATWVGQDMPTGRTTLNVHRVDAVCIASVHRRGWSVQTHPRTLPEGMLIGSADGTSRQNQVDIWNLSRWQL